MATAPGPRRAHKPPPLKPRRIIVTNDEKFLIAEQSTRVMPGLTIYKAVGTFKELLPAMEALEKVAG